MRNLIFFKNNIINISSDFMILDLLNYNDNSLNENVYKFRTNATNFKIHFKIENSVVGNYPHFGLSAREGILLVYKFIDEDYWFNVDAYARRNDVAVNMAHITDGKRMYDVIVYGPNLTSLTELSIEISDEFQSEIIDMNSSRRIMILGGLNSFGIGCTSSGVMFSNIIQRNFNAEVKKIVFNNRNYLENIYNYLKNESIPDVDVSILELDCYNQNDILVEKYLEDIISILEEYSDNIICWLAIPSIKSNKKENALKIINNYDVIFNDLSFIFDESHSDMCAYSNNFINDSANMFISIELTKNLRGALNWNI